MDTIPPLTALRYFESVARLGTVTLAARELHVTHSAVSQQIRILEETMGVPLFLREARGLQLTEEGRLYALEIRAALRNIAQATRIAQTRPQPSELVVATLPSFALHWLLARLPRFRERHPYYSLRLNTSLEVRDIRHGLADIGVRMGQGGWPGLGHQRLMGDELVVVSSPSFRNGELPATTEAIVACPIVLSHDAPWTDWCHAAQIDEPAGPCALAAIDSNIALGAVLRGDGIALERRSLIADKVASGELVQLSPITVPYPYAYWLVWPQRDALSVKQHHFIEWITEEVERYASPQSD
ncbi:MAG TPA: LysR substrate-binding domain-containing protein [Pararobbsia sp.]|nr:LysR substrate-binding domain-containing protein [Pararobbsia sp.]